MCSAYGNFLLSKEISYYQTVIKEKTIEYKSAIGFVRSVAGTALHGCPMIRNLPKSSSVFLHKTDQLLVNSCFSWRCDVFLCERCNFLTLNPRFAVGDTQTQQHFLPLLSRSLRSCDSKDLGMQECD